MALASKMILIKKDNKIFKRPVGLGYIREHADELETLPDEYGDPTPTYTLGVSFLIKDDVCYAFYKEFIDLDNNYKVYIFMQSALACDDYESGDEP